MSEINDLKKQLEESTAVLHQALAEMKSFGEKDVLLEAKIDGANAAVGAAQEKLSATLKAQTDRSEALEKQNKEMDERLRDMHARIDRGELQGGGNGRVDETSQHAARFFSFLRGQYPDRSARVENEVEAYKAYRENFGKYLRWGDMTAHIPGHERGIYSLMQVGADPDGGYWVTPDITGRIATLIHESSPMRQVAAVQVIGTDALEGINDLDQDTGGGWVGETAARAETTSPQIGAYRISVQEQFSSPGITQKLLDDANFDVEGWLINKISMRMSRVENTAFVTGVGGARPRGFTTYNHGTPSAATWNVIERFPTGAAGAFAASATATDVFHDIMGGLKTFYLTGAVWMMARATLAAVRKLKDAENRPFFDPRELAANGRPVLLGHEIVLGEDLPAISANSLSVAFANFREGYQIVDRAGIRLLRDPFTSKPRTLFYTTKRTGGDVTNFEAIKLMRFAVASS